MDLFKFLEERGFLTTGEDYAWFDCESFEEGESYFELFKTLCRISKGKLNPSNVFMKEGYTKNEEYYLTELHFDIERKQKLIKLFCEQWFDPDIILELNKILHVDLGLSEQFYGIETGDQTMIIIFCDKSMIEEFERNHFLYNFNNYSIGKPSNFDLLKIIDYR